MDQARVDAYRAVLAEISEGELADRLLTAWLLDDGVRSLNATDRLLEQLSKAPLVPEDQVTRLVRDSVIKGPNSPGVTPKPTPRETEVLEWAAKGKSIRETAELMGISFYNVAELRKKVLSRLNVKRMPQAVAVAMDNGWI